MRSDARTRSCRWAAAISLLASAACAYRDSSTLAPLAPLLPIAEFCGTPVTIVAARNDLDAALLTDPIQTSDAFDVEACGRTQRYVVHCLESAAPYCQLADRSGHLAFRDDAAPNTQ